jgi:hypothetical protein
MKKIYVFLFLFAHYNYSSAQNYRCLQDRVTHYFTNSTHYLRAMENLRFYSDTTVYYCYFQTARGPHLYGYPPSTPTYGNSWLSDTVKVLPDGTFLFKNMRKDTVVVKTRANVGDAWQFYNDTSGYSYTATVVSIDTMTVLDSLDSVKTIRINAYYGGALNPGDSINGFELKLSKMYGFVQVFDLYTFPYRFESCIDYYYSAIPNGSGQIFRLIKFNAANEAISDFAPGDVYERQTRGGGYYSPPCSDGSYDLGLAIDSFISRTVLDPRHVQYIFRHTGYYESNTIARRYYDNIDTSIVISGPFYSSFPESDQYGYYYYYYPLDTSWCFTSNTYRIVGPMFSNYASCITEQIVKDGFGDVKHTENFMAGGGCDPFIKETISNNLIFAVKNGDSCGTYMPLYPDTSTPDTTTRVRNVNPVTFNIFPNPATDKINILSNNKIADLTVTNLFGQVVYRLNPNAGEIQINIAKLPVGVYLIRLDKSEIRRFIKIAAK